MNKSINPFTKWFFIGGVIYSSIIFLWAISTRSISTNYLIFNFSTQRLLLIGLIFLVWSLFVLGLLASKNVVFYSIFERVFHSKILFLVSFIFSTLFLFIISGTLLKLFGNRSFFFDRILPISLLAFLLFFETFIFQITSSRGQIRFPRLLSKFQPILDEDIRPHSSTYKKPVVFYILVLSLPFLITLLLISFQKFKLYDFHPAEIDEIVYWQEIATFKDIGFGGGYFSIDELTTKSEFSHFGAHGPLFATTYGTLAKLFGWQRFTGPFFNFLAVTVSLVFFLWITKPNKRQSIILIFLISLYFPLIYYIPTIMQESLNHSIAILLSAFLIRLSRYEQYPRIIIMGALITLTFGALLRVTWCIVAFPLFYLLAREKSNRWKAISVFFAFLFSLAMVWVYTYWTSTYPVGFVYKFFSQQSLIDMITLLVNHSCENIGLFFRTTQITGLEIAFHLQYLFIIAIFIVNRNKKGSLANSNLFILGIALIATIMFYDIYDLRDFRTLSPFLLISILSFAFFEHKGVLPWLLGFYFITCILSTSVFYKLYSSNVKIHFSIEHPIEQGFSEAIQEIEFSAGESPWCNSILTSYPLYNEIRVLPPGIGINILLTEVEDIEPKSHYVFVTKTIFDENKSLRSCNPVISSEDRVFCIMASDGCESD